MHFNIRLGATLTAMLLCFICNGQSHIEAFRKQLSESSRNINTIVCDFTQTSCMAVLTSEVNKKGEFTCCKPGNILLAFEDGDFIKLTDKSFAVKSAGKTMSRNINSNPMLKELKKILSACMTGDLDAVSSEFEITVAQNSRTYDITLIPLKDRAMTMVKSIEMAFDRSDMSLSILKMNEPSGDYIKYTFINKRFNTIVNENLFN